MKKITIFFLVTFVLLSPKSEAQLNGEFTYDIATTFGRSIYCNEDGAEDFDCSFHVEPNYFKLGLSSVHNPKTGLFTITGNTDFGPNDTRLQPNAFNSSLPNSEAFKLTSAPTRITGKTYTNKANRKPVFDISSGDIKLLGQYDIGTSEEVLVGIRKGSLGFKGKALDLETAYLDGVDVKVNGSVVLQNKQQRRFNSTLPIRFGWWGNEPWQGEEFTNDAGDRYIDYASLYLDLNLTTTGNNITGSAEIYYAYTTTGITLEFSDTSYHPAGSDQSKWFKYSVKGTRKSGIATLNLTGQGVIKGLKATIHINEATQTIVQNGKNSITLYGQTINY